MKCGYGHVPLCCYGVVVVKAALVYVAAQGSHTASKEGVQGKEARLCASKEMIFDRLAPTSNINPCRDLRGRRRRSPCQSVRCRARFLLRRSDNGLKGR